MPASFIVLAMGLSIVGMLGLASSAAEQRRLEIGIRKAFGAGTPEIVSLITWQFTRLALVATVIGWLVALPLMRHRLEGFADRIGLAPWMIVVAGVLIVVVAQLTVVSHVVLIGRAQPVAALRNE